MSTFAKEDIQLARKVLGKAIAFTGQALLKMEKARLQFFPMPTPDYVRFLNQVKAIQQQIIELGGQLQEERDAL